ncbi:MAG: alpha-amylase family glycosyl hydrolase [Polyangiales bacterium]
MRSAALIGAAILAASCGGHEEAKNPGRSCGVVVWHKPARDDAKVELVAGWEGWVGVHPMARASDGWRAIALNPPPGEQLYAILEDGTWTVDATIGTTAYATVAGVLREVTARDVPQCEVPALAVESASATEVVVKFSASASGDPIDSASVRATIGDQSLPISVDGDRVKVSPTLPVGKHRIAFSARDTAGRDAEGAIATVWNEPGKGSWDWRDAVIYQVVVDRFRDRAGKPLALPSPISARAGGHVDGVRSAIEDGTFASLGVNTLWLSPLYLNPRGEWPGLDGKNYSSYHGYWPIAARALDPAVADEASLDALMSSAHAHGMRVLFDVVPNHVHEQHPYVTAHASWFTQGSEACVCGLAGCDWATHELTCRFATYLPDFDFRDLDASRQVASDVDWWIDRFSGDGVRIDAVPLMPRSEIRRIASTLRKHWDHPGNRTLSLGETFVGAGDQSALRYFLGPSGLDSEFDFPLMWSLRAVLAEKSAPMTALDDAIRKSQQAWDGSGAVMSLIVGNHDVPRFVSVAHGDSGDGWTPAPQPTDVETINRLGVALGAIFALPGAPTIYYGDEIALAGTGDPDQRRTLPGDDALAPAQKVLRDRVRAMGRLRACLPALRRGTYRTLASDAEHLLFARELDGEATVVVVLTRTGGTFAAPLPGISSGSWVDALVGTERSFTATTTFDESSLSVRYYVQGGYPCLTAP